MEIKMTIKQVDRLFKLTELHLKWFEEYHPEDVPSFSTLLKINHHKIINYITLRCLGVYNESTIDNKLNRLSKVYYSLFEIAEYNRQGSRIIHIDQIV